MEKMELTELATRLVEAKKNESNEKKKRIDIEEQIAALVETGPNQSKTVDAGNGLKLTVKRSLSYDVDINSIRAIAIDDDQDFNLTIPLKLMPAVPSFYVFNPKVYEDLVKESPAAAKLFAPHITTKPKKVSVTVKM